MVKLRFIAFIILINCTLASAEPLQISVVGLFNNQAVLKINQTQHLLKVGQTSPEGVKLVAANSQRAIVEVDGKQQSYQLGNEIGGDFGQAPEQPAVSIWPTNGMYLTTGNINGYSVDFLVDTGASAIALNAATARRLNIDFERGLPVGVKTASGAGLAYKVTLDRVQVGEIIQYNVTAVVMDGPAPERALLGMTFLGQLDMQHNGDRLDLKQKY